MQDQQEFLATPVTPPKRRNVKSGAEAASDGAADRHERAKNFLTGGEITRLLDAAKLL